MTVSAETRLETTGTISPVSPAGDADAAATLTVRHTGPNGLDIRALAADVRDQRATDPEGAAATLAKLEETLTPVERGQLAAALDGPPDRPANDNSRGGSHNAAQLALDLAQMTLDITGIIDPTPISDGSNAAVSAGRALGSLFSGDWGGAGDHLVNAGISAVSMVPAFGDLAKAGKIGDWAQTVADAVGAVSRTPAMRETLEPALKAVGDAVNAVPQGAIDALPAGARQSVESMRAQLDEFFAGGGRVTDDAAGLTVRSFDNAADFNRAANHADPNTRYEYGNYSYSTDAQGRVEVAEGEITLDPVGRNDPSLQRQIGHEGRDTDVGFHIVADRFGGQTNRLNVVPGNGKPLGDGQPNLNQGAYSRFEDRIAKLAEQRGNRVEVRIEMNYDANNATARPDSFDAAYRVNEGRWIEQSFVNK